MNNKKFKKVMKTLNNKQEKLDLEFNAKLKEIQEKTCRALQKLEEEYGTRFQVLTFIRMEDESWTQTSISGTGAKYF